MRNLSIPVLLPNQNLYVHVLSPFKLTLPSCPWLFVSSANGNLQNGEFIPSFVPNSSRALFWYLTFTLERFSDQLNIFHYLHFKRIYYIYSLNFLPLNQFIDGKDQWQRGQEKQRNLNRKVFYPLTLFSPKLAEHSPWECCLCPQSERNDSKNFA